MPNSSILLIWDRMGDYHVARWKTLSALSDSPVYAGDFIHSDEIYGWDPFNADNHFCFAKPNERSRFPALQRCVRFIQVSNIHTVCIPGYGKVSYVLLIIACRLLRKKVILFAESWYPGGTWKDALKGFLLRVFTPCFFVSGLRAKVHFEARLKIPADRIRLGYSVVDNEHFSHPEEQSDCSALGQRKVLLCVARFAPEKNLIALVNAFAVSVLPESGWRLQLVGGGPLKEELQTLSEEYSWLEIRDWVSYKELPKLYNDAAAFILPSTFEPWGLVINEAMAAGLPVLASDSVGAVADLVDEKNGWIFSALSESNICESLNKLARTNDDERRRLGENGRSRVSGFSCEHWAKQVLELSNSVR